MSKYSVKVLALLATLAFLRPDARFSRVLRDARFVWRSSGDTLCNSPGNSRMTLRTLRLEPGRLVVTNARKREELSHPRSHGPGHPEGHGLGHLRGDGEGHLGGHGLGHPGGDGVGHLGGHGLGHLGGDGVGHLRGHGLGHLGGHGVGHLRGHGLGHLRGHGGGHPGGDPGGQSGFPSRHCVSSQLSPG